MAEDGKIIYKVVINSDGAVESAEEGGKKAGDSFGNRFSSVLGAAGKIGAAAVGLVTTATAAATAAIVDGTKSVAAYGDNIDKMSQKLGMSAETYQEWDAIMQHSGTTIEAMQSSMKTLATAAETGNAAFKELGITEEELATLNQEELFARTIEALQNVESDTQRTYLAGKLLGRGATELGALLNTSAEDTEKMRQRVHELGGVMSDEAVKAAAAYQDSLQDMTTAFAGLKRGLVSEMLPGIKTVMDGLTEIFSGNEETGLALVQNGIDDVLNNISKKLPEFINVGLNIIESLASAIVDNLPRLLEVGSNLIIELVGFLIENAPKFLEAGIQIILTLADGLTGAAPQLVPAIVEVIGELLQSISQHLPEIVTAGIEILTALIQGLVNAIPTLIEQAPLIIKSLFEAIVENAPQLLEAGIKLIGALAEGIVQAWLEIPRLFMDYISAIRDIFAEVDWGEIGANIVEGIKNGIMSLWDGLVETVTNAASDLWNSVKDFFGIASPSKKFKYIGEMSVEGTKEGFEEGEADLTRTVKTLYKNVGDTATTALHAAAFAPDFSSASFARDVSYEINNSRANYATGGTTNYITVNGIDELEQVVNWYQSREIMGRMA